MFYVRYQCRIEGQCPISERGVRLVKTKFVLAAGAALMAVPLGGYVLNASHQQTFLMAPMTGSNNWSGYIDTQNGQPFTDITGSWKVPTITGQEQSTNAQWIGLGGVLSHSLLQMGTLEAIQNGQQVDELFWEKLPNAAVPIVQVQPGDVVSTEIQHLQGNNWQLVARVSDGTQTVTKKVNVQVSSSYAAGIEQTAEWISEDPSNGQNQILPMANAGTVTFTNATVNGGPISQSNASTQETTLVSPYNGATVVPTQLSQNGTSFSTVPQSQSGQGGFLGDGGQGGMPGVVQVMPGSQGGMPGVVEVMPGSQGGMPGVVQVMPGGQGGMPGVVQVIPGGDDDSRSQWVPSTISIPGNAPSSWMPAISQMWQQLQQMENQLLQQWSQPNTSIPNVVQNAPSWVQQLSSYAGNHVRSWSGGRDGWHWTIQVLGN